jgi:hypothetical protein
MAECFMKKGKKRPRSPSFSSHSEESFASEEEEAEKATKKPIRTRSSSMASCSTRTTRYSDGLEMLLDVLTDPASSELDQLTTKAPSKPPSKRRRFQQFASLADTMRLLAAET